MNKIVEDHRLSDYVILPATAPSKLIKGARQHYDPIFSCPSCGEQQSVPEHGENSKCKNHKCGLHWHVRGANIKIWRD